MSSHQRTFEVGGVSYPWEGPVKEYWKEGRQPVLRSEVKVDRFNLDEDTDVKKYERILTDVANGRKMLVNDRHLEHEGTLKVICVHQRTYACDPDYDPCESKEKKTPVEVQSSQQGVETNEADEETPPETSEEDEAVLSEIPEDCIPMSSISSRSKKPDEQDENFIVEGAKK